MLPSEFWESAEVGVGRNHSASHARPRWPRAERRRPASRRPPSRGTAFRICPGGRVRDPRCARVGRFQERGHEREGLVQRGRRVEDSGVGYDADETGQNQDGKSERFRSRRHTGDPGCIRGAGPGWSPRRARISGHSRREATSRINGSRACTRLRRPAHRAPAAGPGPLRGGRERRVR